MEKRISMLMTESSPEFNRLCLQNLEPRGIDVLSCPPNGKAVYQKLAESQPDAALLELFMPGMDAISLKAKYDSKNRQTKTSFFAMGAVNSEQIERELIEHGFQFYFLKPFDEDNLADWVLSSQGGIHTAAAPAFGGSEVLITDMLREIGVPAHVKGYRFLRDSIVMVVDDPSLIHAVTKELYPNIARAHGTIATRVERAIRHAIEIAWDRGDLDVIDRYFGGTIDAMRGKPTNSEFIAMLADHIVMSHHI